MVLSCECCSFVADCKLLPEKESSSMEFLLMTGIRNKENGHYISVMFLTQCFSSTELVKRRGGALQASGILFFTRSSGHD